MVLASYLVVSGGIRWFQLVLDRFRPFHVLVSTERLNVGIDLMCSFLCKDLLHISFCTKLQSF